MLRYYPSYSYLQRYRESPHKARIDHVAAALVARRYRDAVISQHLHEWLEFTSYFDTRGITLPSSGRVPEVEAYLAQRLPDGSASRRRCIRAAVRIFLDTDDHGDFPLRMTAPVRPLSAWCAGRRRPIAASFTTIEGSPTAPSANRSGNSASSPNSWS